MVPGQRVEKLAQDLIKKHGKGVMQMSVGHIEEAMIEAGCDMSPFNQDLLMDRIFELVDELREET